MKQKKEVKGLSRRMRCKLVAGGAVAVVGNCLLPGSPLMVGRDLLFGVQLAEAGADLSQVSILARREIEARILMPVLNTFIKEYGKEQTVKLVDSIIQELAREGGVQLAKALERNTIGHFAKGLSLWTREDALQLDVKEQTETKFAYNVTRCRGPGVRGCSLLADVPIQFYQDDSVLWRSFMSNFDTKLKTRYWMIL